MLLALSTTSSPQALRRRTRSLLYVLVGVLTLSAGWAAADPIQLEAEAATGVVRNGVVIATSPLGFSGTGFVTGFDAPDGSDNIVFTLPATTPTGEYELLIGYTSPFGDKSTRLLINGVSTDLVLPSTATGAVFQTRTAGKFQLAAGASTITLIQNWGYYGIDYIRLTPVSNPLRLEAEATTGVTLNGVVIANTQPGFSGTGYAWEFDSDANGGDNIVFTFPASVTAGDYDLTIGYYSPYGDKKTRVQVNNGAATEYDLKATGTNFSTVTIGKFALVSGVNKVTITKNWGYYGIDYIVFAPASVKPPTIVPMVNGRIEAELGDLTGVTVSSATTGFSGTGYVTDIIDATDKITLTFNATAGLVDMAIGYAAPFGQKNVDFQVNDDGGSTMLTSAMFASTGAGRYLLKEGLNTVTIYRGWGYFNVDYIQFTPTTASLPAKPPKTLVDASATQSTKGLFAYIIDQYGSKTISGQQDEVEYVLEKTGKEPALGSFDLIDYSPSRVSRGSMPIRTSEQIIAWAKKNEGRGIISLMWHWNAPTDLIDQAPDKLWWRGFYTDATTFDIAAVLADKTGPKYGLLLSDIDAIAVQLKKFQAADVPVLWRPLHEASGGWFWWGAKGAGPLKELWQIMYERLTNYHQLHNLIWVYTSTDTFLADWYPGDQYVDIVGMDIYANATSNLSSNWTSTQAALNGRKLVTLSETGNPPNMAKVRGFATWWSWFSTWTGDYIRNQPVDALTALFNDPDVITRDELPDWRAAAPLPVRLISFTARAAGPGTVALDWATASERNNAYFAVERSQDALHFTPIGQVDGAGTSSTYRHYAFTDRSPAPGINYYRLRQVDSHGAFEFSPVRSAIIRTHGELRVLGNPASDQLTVSGLEPHSLLTVTDLQGRTRHQQLTSDVSVPLDARQWPGGVYVLSVSDWSGIQSIRVVIQH